MKIDNSLHLYNKRLNIFEKVWYHKNILRAYHGQNIRQYDVYCKVKNS